MHNAKDAAAHSDVLDRISGWLDRWVNSNGGELNRMSDAEVAQVARDIGLSVSELETLSHRRDDMSELLRHRLAVLGLEPERLASAGYLRDLERTCAMCESKGVCQHDLAARPESGEWAEYCPNSSVLLDPETTRAGAGDTSGTSGTGSPAL